MTNHVIPAEAVEAAAEAIIHAAFGQELPEAPEAPEDLARAALEAGAAPLEAEVWSAGSARTELAALLGKHYGTSAGGDDHLWAMADIITSRGWAKRRAVEAVEDLEILPVGSVILDTDGDPWKKRPDGQWLGLRNELEESNTLFWGHMEIRPTILHEATA